MEKLLAKNTQRWMFYIKKWIRDRKRRTEKAWGERGPIMDGVKNRNVFLLLADNLPSHCWLYTGR